MNGNILKGEIYAAGLKVSDVAECCGMANNRISEKLNNRRRFKPGETSKIRKAIARLSQKEKNNARF
ncbi:MAG: hypothetical protein WCX65_06700 [bacterium]